MIAYPRSRARALGAAAALPLAFAAMALSAGCGSSDDPGGSGASGNAGGASGGGPTGGLGGLGGLTGAGGSAASSGAGGTGGFVACTGTSSETEAVGALDMYLIFDRTASMGQDCDFTPGTNPPVNSKACFATYALAQYFMSPQTAGHRLAFEFMSVPDGECSGGPNNGEATPLIDMTALPVNQNHALVQAISDETFEGGLGTEIEAALRGIATYTAGNVTPGRTMIGILMTDGDPNGCEDDENALARIVADHFAATNIKTFFIGMNGASLDRLEVYAAPGGAQPHTDFCGNGPNPCHYWDVGNGNPAASLSALQAIAGQGVVPCVYAIPTTTSTGEAINFAKVNVQYRQSDGTPVTVGQVPAAADCGPSGGWYYNTNPTAARPTAIHLCPATCELAKTAGTDAGVNVVFGCSTQTVPQ